MALVGNISGSIQNNSNIGVSGSVVIANRPDALFPTLGSVGGDVVFFVSGSRGGKGNTAERTVSVFGGDAVVSGSLTIGTGSVTITSNDITFAGGVTQIFSGSGGLTFKDSSGTKTLASLSTGGGDVTGPTGATANAIARFDLTTGKLIKNSEITISDLAGSSVTFETFTATEVSLFPTTPTSITIGKTASTVTIPGNLTVQGTTTTIDTNQLVIEDPLIYFASGSTSSNQNGGIAIASGSSVTNQALVWGRVANDVWGAGRQDVTGGLGSDLTLMNLTPVRASQFQVGSSGFTSITSSLGTDLVISGSTSVEIKHALSSNTQFVADNNAYLQITSGSGGKAGAYLTTQNNNALSLTATNNAIGISAGSSSPITLTAGAPNNTNSAIRFSASTSGIPYAYLLSGSTAGYNNHVYVQVDTGKSVGFSTQDPAQKVVFANVAPGGGAYVNFVSSSYSVGVTDLNVGKIAGDSTNNNSLALDVPLNKNIIFANNNAPVAFVGPVTINGSPTNGLYPADDRVQSLGAPTKRWSNIYTGDLHLRNERGDYTLIEEEDFLSIRFNKTGKRYKFLLEPVPELDEK